MSQVVNMYVCPVFCVCVCCEEWALKMCFVPNWAIDLLHLKLHFNVHWWAGRERWMKERDGECGGREKDFHMEA